MEKLENIQTYYSIYNAVREIPRFKLKYIAEILKLSGRGKTYTTASNYVSKLYERRISFFPNLILKTYENCCTNAYFLKVKNPKNVTKMFSKLSKDKSLSYMLLLSGKYDFFVASKHDLTFEEELTIKKKSILYTPIYTHPLGWNLEVKDAFKKIADSSPLKGNLERKMEDWLPWDQNHFDIFEIMRNNVQLPFSRVAKKTNLSQNTVQKYFNEGILPYCNIAHYFFPRGYDHYHKSLIMLRSKYEKGLVELLSKLPCTSYVFPLERETALILFHEGVDDVMFAFKKLEEKGCIDRYLLLVPLHWE